MKLFVKVQKNHYLDSILVLFAASALNEDSKVEKANVAMGTAANKEIFTNIGLIDPEIDAAGDNDLVIAAVTESQEHFDELVLKVAEVENESNQKLQGRKTYHSLEQAVADQPRANICSIAVPGEYALEEVKKALNKGLHCVVFSANVPIEQEREMKELAREKGLLCMGPDCGVANINGAAFVLASINNRGPFGICGASGCGVQHVAAMLHECGSGVSQAIGTGGSDLKEPVGGITMLMGIDALEADPATKYIVLISRKPADSVLKKILSRVSGCKKPVVACFLGSGQKEVEASGAIWAKDLDDCGLKALSLIGQSFEFDTDEEITKIAQQAIVGMKAEQKYVRGIYCGGTYCDEAMNVMQRSIGGIHSNCPLSPELKLADSYKSEKNTVIDYGEEEFTMGKPHPTLEPSMRLPAIIKEGEDPETAVILLDFILTPPEHIDPAGVTLEAINKAVAAAKARGGKIAVVASVLGTDADLQNVKLQRQKLRDAGVYLCKSNRQAGQLAAEIIRLKNARDAG